MTIAATIRTLAVAPGLAAALVGAPADAAHAKDSNFSAALSCELRGYVWSDTQGCADKSCQFFGDAYHPGDVVQVRLAGGGSAYYLCNGFTGRMEPYGLRPGTTPRRTVGPLPTTVTTTAR